MTNIAAAVNAFETQAADAAWSYRWVHGPSWVGLVASAVDPTALALLIEVGWAEDTGEKSSILTEGNLHRLRTSPNRAQQRVAHAIKRQAHHRSIVSNPGFLFPDVVERHKESLAQWTTERERAEAHLAEVLATAARIGMHLS